MNLNVPLCPICNFDDAEEIIIDLEVPEAHSLLRLISSDVTTALSVSVMRFKPRWVEDHRVGEEDRCVICLAPRPF